MITTEFISSTYNEYAKIMIKLISGLEIKYLGNGLFFSDYSRRITLFNMTFRKDGSLNFKNMSTYVVRYLSKKLVLSKTINSFTDFSITIVEEQHWKSYKALVIWRDNKNLVSE